MTCDTVGELQLESTHTTSLRDISHQVSIDMYSGVARVLRAPVQRHVVGPLKIDTGDYVGV